MKRNIEGVRILSKTWVEGKPYGMSAPIAPLAVLGDDEAVARLPIVTLETRADLQRAIQLLQELDRAAEMAERGIVAP